MEIIRGDVLIKKEFVDERQQVIDIAKDVFLEYVCNSGKDDIYIYRRDTRFFWIFPSKGPVVHIRGGRKYIDDLGVGRLSYDDLEVLVYDSKLMYGATSFCKEFERCCKGQSYFGRKATIYKNFSEKRDSLGGDVNEMNSNRYLFTEDDIKIIKKCQNELTNKIREGLESV